MPFKCSVRGCRSNYDSMSHEGKVTVFSIPQNDQELRRAWLSNLTLTSTKKSARVCIKHFNPLDIENQSKRNSLKTGAVPSRSTTFHHDIKPFVEEDTIEVQEVELEETIDEDIIEGFDELCGGIDELQGSLLTDWNVFTNSDGICFYHLAPLDEEFSNLTMSFKILINRNMKIRLFQNDLEASFEELGDANLSTWTQLGDLLTKYQPEPQIDLSREPCVHLKKALESLDLITHPELAQELDVMKIQLECLYAKSEKIADEGLYQNVIEEEFVIEEANSEPEGFLEEASMESMNESEVKTRPRRSTDTFKCRYCSVKLLSAKGLKSHETNCNFFGQTSTSSTHVGDDSMMDDDQSELLDSFEIDAPKSDRKKRSYRYPCKICSTPERKKVFITKLQAAQHFLDKHDIVIKNVRNFCFICGAEFDDYINHVRVHSCKFTCNFCGSKFLTESKLEHHRTAKHAGESESDRPFKCNEKDCGFYFKKISHLKSHQLSHHLQQNSEEFKCEHCDKTFGRQLLLRVHSRLHFHTFECNYIDCTRIFKKLSSLKEHYLKEHNVADIYMCNVDDCEERFQMLSQLKQHREEKHGRESIISREPRYFDGADKMMLMKEDELV